MNDIRQTMIDRWVHNYVEYNHGSLDDLPDWEDLAHARRDAASLVDAILEQVTNVDLDTVQGSLLMDVNWIIGWRVQDPHDYDEIGAMVELVKKFKLETR